MDINTNILTESSYFFVIKLKNKTDISFSPYFKFTFFLKVILVQQ